jgi:hypothetical protein
MTIELNDESYIVGMWFSSCPKTHNDWMACVIADPDRPGCFKGWSRFRITKDDKIWDSEDEKKWTYFSSAPENTEEDMIAIMRGLQNSLASGYPDKDKIIVKGDMKKLFRLSKGHSWLNLKEAKA